MINILYYLLKFTVTQILSMPLMETFNVLDLVVPYRLAVFMKWTTKRNIVTV